ncbi:acyltransferase [Bacteroides sp.]|uniref:acyltransferase family protein n=1 Tax=Bacteroides sp. TaxID=29523 RepID=UPI001B5F2D28|nr:acyltransferase [Bacteroides sp.]MBP6066233.1 acyltransferase [Bacteroides sp.]MBP6068623.1 acyltransferase [Bacteroides sp.]MBP6936647.1 acyltransferase [Bacteroides sp.]MBP8621971.1 acyltransferase [Bacteroides sp.]MBP9507875.1 acyltransferase [Bacteroides sp.]
MSKISSAAFADTKPHYDLLDGLRGVAALMVLWYHVFEGYAFAGNTAIETFNHGYLAVDFFFLLSGFVIGYAYDDRWGKSLTLKEFFKRRVIRLHPMVIMGAVLGVVAFCMQGSEQWDGTPIALSMIMLSMLCTIFFIPALPGAGYEVRGNGEMFPLNGPYWSLFFEYIGNILYALFIRRLSTKALTVLVVLLGIGLTSFAIFNVSGYGSIGVGWTLDSVNVLGGTLRMLFPFSMGMLLSRNFKPMKIRGAFWICSAALITLFAMPYFEGTEPFCTNGIYEAFCVIVAFPLLLWIGASGTTTDKTSTKLCKLLGDISYPLYVIHYPVMYLFYAWLIKNQLFTFGETWQVTLCVYAGCIVIAYLSLKLYDVPVRAYLAKRFLKTSVKKTTS